MSAYLYTTRNGKRRKLHIVLMEEMLGRPLAPDEVVHHINGNKRDNRPENLRLMTRGAHSRLHQLGSTPSSKTVFKLRQRKNRPSEKRKLNGAQVRDIAELLLRDEALARIARDYNVSVNAIADIRDGICYREFLTDYPDRLFPLREKKYSQARRASQEKRLFTEAQVQDIRRRILAGESDASIARSYKVSRTAVRRARDRKTYGNIPWPEG